MSRLRNIILVCKARLREPLTLASELLNPSVFFHEPRDMVHHGMNVGCNVGFAVALKLTSKRLE